MRLSRVKRILRGGVEQLRSGPRLLVFNFHQVSKEFHPEKQARGTWTALVSFEAFLDEVKSRYEVLPLLDGIQKLKRNELVSNSVAITFDDGDESVRNVIPVLSSREMPATFFLNTEMVGPGYSDWTRLLAGIPEGERRKFFLTLRNTDSSEEYQNCLRELQEKAKLPDQECILPLEYFSSLDSNLFQVGCHGHSHNRQALLTVESQRENIVKNQKILSSKIKNFVPLFATPFGRSFDVNEDTARICRECGLELLMANGGLNTTRSFQQERSIRRVPSDSRTFRELRNRRFC